MIREAYLIFFCAQSKTKPDPDAIPCIINTLCALLIIIDYLFGRFTNAIVNIAYD